MTLHLCIMLLHYSKAEYWVDRGPKIEKYVGDVRFRLYSVLTCETIQRAAQEAVSSNGKTRVDYWVVLLLEKREAEAGKDEPR